MPLKPGSLPCRVIKSSHNVKDKEKHFVLPSDCSAQPIRHIFASGNLWQFWHHVIGPCKRERASDNLNRERHLSPQNGGVQRRSPPQIRGSELTIGVNIDKKLKGSQPLLVHSTSQRIQRASDAALGWYCVSRASSFAFSTTLRLLFIVQYGADYFDAFYFPVLASPVVPLLLRRCSFRT